MSPKMVQRYHHADQAAMRVVAAALDEKPFESKQTKSRRKGTVVEIIPRPALAPERTRLCLPSAEEDK
jgi:hypothetical protein